MVSYRITVKNLGPDPAQRVVLADQPNGRVAVVGVHDPVGGCTVTLPVVCRLGTIQVGQTETIIIRYRVLTPRSSLINEAVVGSSTNESTLANNTARATVRVIAPPPPPPPTPPIGLG